jgi:photosystem II stability/assembly factor-like uncharacterized protein
MKTLTTILICSFFLILIACIKKTCPEPIVSVPADTSKSICHHIVTKWNPEKSISSNNFYKTFFINSSDGWISGANGTILKTTDAGQSWSTQNSNTTQGIYSMYFLNPNLGYATGGDTDPNGLVLKTTNGGQTWNVLLNNTLSGRAIYFTDSLVGFVGGSTGWLVKTTDGGQTWSTITTGITGSIGTIQFIDANTGYLAGAKGEIFKTTNGGNTWTSLPNNMPTGINDAYYSMSFIDQNNGYLCGYSYSTNLGYIIKTTDGGQSWISLPNTSYYLAEIRMVDVNTGYIAGGTVGSSGQILKITNGTTWNIEQTVSSFQTGLSLYSCSNAISVGRSGSIVMGD